MIEIKLDSIRKQIVDLPDLKPEAMKKEMIRIIDELESDMYQANIKSLVYEVEEYAAIDMTTQVVHHINEEIKRGAENETPIESH